MTRLVWCAAAAAAAAVAGVSCRLLDPLQCTLNLAPGIVVTIVDSASGAPRAAEAVAVARESEFADTLGPREVRNNVLISRQGAHERPGFYVVIVQAPGYAEWRRSGVVVWPGDCHVRTAEFEARLKSL